jgi:hypothetical protein
LDVHQVKNNLSLIYLKLYNQKGSLLALKDLQLKGTYTKKVKLLLPAQLKQKTMQKQVPEKLVLRSVLRSEVKKMLS